MLARRDVMSLAAAAAFAALVPSTPSRAAGKVRAGVLKFGTVSWELNTIKHHRLDAANAFELEVIEFAGEDATNVAILAGEIDVIVSDWLWVSRERSAGEDLTLIPFSAAVGAIMVRQDSPIRSLANLKGSKIGVAGGPLDKSWLLIQALAKRREGMELSAENAIVYGAPPLMSEKAIQGELDAVLNFWHFCARLEANGFRRLIGADEAATALGATGKVSALGYVFREAWANENRDTALAFARASAQAKDILASSDAEWLRLAPLVRAEGRELEVLRDRYREGIPRRSVAEEEADAGKLYRVLAEIGGERLVGASPDMAPGTFWAGLAE